MKRLLLASTGVLLTATAFAADLTPRLPVKAPPLAAPPPFSWTGCYIGAHAGAGWSRTVFTDTTGGNFAPAGDTVTAHGGTGFVGGGQVGCDYQFASNWVIGAAGDFSWADIEGQANDPFFAGKLGGAPLTLGSRTEFLADATGRLGYTWNHVLVYGKGGAAWTRAKYEVNNWNCVIFTACFSSATPTQFGWTAGGGVEWVLAPNWTALIEYDHYGFGSHTYTFVDPTEPSFTARPFGVKQDVDLVKVGVNFRFGGLIH